MHLTLRPSKSFIFDVLEHDLSRHTSGVGLDAGSAHLRNRGIFHTSLYYGLDLRSPDISEGLKKFPDQSTWGIHADLTNIKLLPSDSVDVVVSTNTLYHLPKQTIIGAIAELARVTRPNGSFTLELPIDDDFDARIDVLKEVFNDVDITYYKNPISRAYEGFFEHDGYLGSHSVAGSLPFLLISWILSRTEYLTRNSRSLNRHALIIAADKKEKHMPQPFDLSRFPLVDRIYELVS